MCPELFPAVCKGHVRIVCKRQCPVDSRVPAAAYEDIFIFERFYIIDKIVQVFPFILFSLFDFKFSRLESTDTGGDQNRPCTVDFIISFDSERFIFQSFNILDSLIKYDGLFKHLHLLSKMIDELLSADFRNTCDVVYILLRIERRQLAAALRHAFDNFDFSLSHTSVESGEQSCRTAAY